MVNPNRRRRQATPLVVSILALTHTPQISAFIRPPSQQLTRAQEWHIFTLDDRQGASGEISTGRHVRKVKLSKLSSKSSASSKPILSPSRSSSRSHLLERSNQLLHRLTHEEEMSLLREMRSHPSDTLQSQAARQMLLLHNLPLVQSIVTKSMRAHPRLFVQRSEIQVGSALSRDDLLHEGTIGLAEALDKYDFIYSDLNAVGSSFPQGARFGTYATYWIRARIMRAIQSREYAFRFPERTLQASHRLVKAAKVLELKWSEVLELQDAETPEKEKLRLTLSHLAGITTDSLFREAIRVHNMSSSTTTTQLESWMSSRSSGANQQQQLEVNESPETGCQHIHDTLSQFLTGREVQVLSLRYGLACSDEENCDVNSQQPAVYRDYQAEAEEDLFGPNGILAHYSDVPVETKDPAVPKQTSSVTNAAAAAAAASAPTATTLVAGSPVTTRTLPTMTKPQINLSTSSALLPFKEVGKRMKFSGEYCRRLCTEALKKLTIAAEEGRLAESDFLMCW